MSTIQVICCLIIIPILMTIPVPGKSLHTKRTHAGSDNSSDYIARKHWRPHFRGINENIPLPERNFDIYYSYNRPVLRMNYNAAGTTKRPPKHRKYSPPFPVKNGKERMVSDFNVAMDNDLRIRNLMEELVLKSRLIHEYDIFERMENDIELKTDKNRNESPQTVGGDMNVKIRNDFALPEYGKTAESANVKSDSAKIYTEIENNSTELLITDDKPDLEGLTSYSDHGPNNISKMTTNVEDFDQNTDAIAFEETIEKSENVQTSITRDQLYIPLKNQDEPGGGLLGEKSKTDDLNKTILKEQLDFLQLNAPKINNREHLNGMKSSTDAISTNIVETKTYSEEIVATDDENSNIKNQLHSIKEPIQSTNELTQIVRPIFYSNIITEYTVTSDSNLQHLAPQSITEFEDSTTNVMSKVTNEFTNVDETTQYFETVKLFNTTESLDIGIKDKLQMERTTEAVSTTISAEDDNMKTSIFIEEALENTASFPISNVNDATNYSSENLQVEKTRYELDDQVYKRLDEVETTNGHFLPNHAAFMPNSTKIDGDRVELSIMENCTNMSDNDNFSSTLTTAGTLLQRKAHPEKLDEDVTATINCHTSLAEVRVEAVECGDKYNFSANNPAILKTNNYRYDNIAKANGQSTHETSQSQDIAEHEEPLRKCDDVDKDSDDDNNGEDDVEDDDEIKTVEMSVNEKEMLNIFEKDNNNTYENVTAQDKNEALAALDENAGENASEYDNHDDELDADSSDDGDDVEVYDDVKVSNDDNVDDDDEDNTAEEVVSEVSQADTANDGDDNGQADDVEAASASAETDSVIDRTPPNGGRDEISFDRRAPDTQEPSQNDTMFTEGAEDDALARLVPSTSPSPSPSPPPKTVRTEATTANGDTTAYSAALKQILSDPDIKTTNWWHSLSYAEIRNFLNTIFDTAAHELYEDFVRKSKEVQSGKRLETDVASGL